MLSQKWSALRAWISQYTHLCLHEFTTKLGLLVTALATVLPGFARFDVRIAYAAAAAGVVLVLIKPGRKENRDGGE